MINGMEQPLYKKCAYCGADKPISEFRRRTGRRFGPNSRRGVCSECRRQTAKRNTSSVPQAERNAGNMQPTAVADNDTADSSQIELTKRSRSQKRRAARKRAKARAASIQQESPGIEGDSIARLPSEAITSKLEGAYQSHVERNQLPQPTRPMRRSAVVHEHPDPFDVSLLVPMRSGAIRMRGRTDKGRRWHQEIEPELAFILVKENAAVVVNRHTIRRLYTNKGFRKYVLERDGYRCYFCGGYGDTIDHLLPRAKGGHTTPVNCVCACMECNQSKADRDLDDFMNSSR